MSSTTASQFKLWQRLRRRLIVIMTFVLVLFFLIVFRVAELQIVHGKEYYQKSQRVIRKVVPLISPRGEIFDRNYIDRENSIPLATNTARLDLVAIPSHFEIQELRQDIILLEKILNLPPKSLQKKITSAKLNRNEEILLIKDLTSNQHNKLADFYLNFSRFIVKQTSTRHYNHGPLFAHTLGYVGKPSPKDIDRGIESYQIVGKNGLEAWYDRILRGEDGEIVQIKTARGEIEEQRVFENFVPGNNLVSTLDLEIQRASWKAFAKKRGALIAIKPSTGEVISLVSKPDFNPNILLSLDKKKRLNHINEIQKYQAELNRAIATKHPPASSFKPLVALAALEEGRVTPQQKYNCKGKFILKSSYSHLPDTVFHDWRTFGWIDMNQAIANSCSVYFYELGYKIGSEPIIKYSRYFHLDKLSGIDLPSEVAGFIPSPVWKEKRFNQRWFDGDTINLSIGQGFIETTLIGMLNFYAAIINGGIVYRPHLIKEIRFAENDKIRKIIKPELFFELPIARSTLKTIRNGMRDAIRKGTVRAIDRGIFPLAGKTGTVQTISNDRFNNSSQHAWFIGYGPFEGNNKLLVGVFVERGIGGAIGAAPIARETFRAWKKVISKTKLNKAQTGNL